MSNSPKSQVNASTSQHLSPAFLRLGWIGFFVQTLLGLIPILVVIIYALAKWGQPAAGRLSVGLGLALTCLIMLIFSIYWCFRYTKLARRLKRQNSRLTYATMVRDLKLGLFTNIGVMAISVLIALIRVGELTFKLLTLPQGATVIAPNQIGTTLAVPGALVTPSSLIAIQATLNVIAAGLVGIIIALQLLFRVERSRNTTN